MTSHNMENENVLNEFLKTLLEGAKRAGAFMEDQLPMVLQEYIMWGVAQGVITALVCFALTYGCYRAFRWGLATLKEDEYSSGGMVACIVGGLAALPLLCFGIAGLFHAIKALVAPRVYLIEELSKLIR